jgi:hypothetical protein
MSTGLQLSMLLLCWTHVERMKTSCNPSFPPTFPSVTHTLFNTQFPRRRSFRDNSSRSHHRVPLSMTPSSTNFKDTPRVASTGEGQRTCCYDGVAFAFCTSALLCVEYSGVDVHDSMQQSSRPCASNSFVYFDGEYCH